MDEIIALEEQNAHPVILTCDEANELSHHGMDVLYEEPAIPEASWTKEVFEPQPFRIGHDTALGEKDHHLFLVNPLHFVGHFRLRTNSQRVVYIKPKVRIRNIFALLGVAYKYYIEKPPFLPEIVHYQTDKALVFEPLVRQFNEAVERFLQEGLLRQYVEHEQNLRVLRGRLIFSKNLSQNLVRQDRLYCRFAQSEVDIPENQVILWTLLLLQRSGEWSKDVRQALQSHILHFGGVSVRQFLPQQCPPFHYDRLSFRYEEVHSWCKLFIDLMSLSDKSGENNFSGYLLNMYELFERFVVAMFEGAAKRVPSVKTKYHNINSFDLNHKIQIIPDLILKTSNGAKVVLDAKYKRTEGLGNAKHPDLYQIVAYSMALGLVGQDSSKVQGMLVYPISQQRPELEGQLNIITHQGPASELTVQVVWLDLNSENLVKETERRFIEILKGL